MSTTKTPLSQIISLSDLPWQERQPGVRGKSIWEHPESKRRAMMTRIAPGAQLPLHRHVGDELVFVIEGAISDEFGTITAGNMGYRPNRCVHTVSSPNGATVVAILTGGVEPLTQRSSGPASQVFALSELPWIEAPRGCGRSGSGRTRSPPRSGARSSPSSSRAPSCRSIGTSATS